MAQPNVAREPSMEEILASIRKIIESNDPEAPRDFSSPMSNAYGDEGGDIGDEAELTIEDETMATAAIFAANDERPRAEMQHYTPEPSRQSFAQPSANDAEPPKNISLADLAARVRAAADRAEPGVPASASSSVPPAQMRRPEPAAAPAAGPQTAHVSHSLAGLRGSEAPLMTAPLRPSMVEEPIRNAIRDAADEALSLPKSVDEKTRENALISAETGAYVARSFGDLAKAVDGEQRRSLDEMAEELLRPMLKEWLDDNLPTLVERLVREEIERVARGPRR